MANDNKKPKGRTVNFETLEWSGLLYCMNHPEPYKVSSLNFKGCYVCQRNCVQEGTRISLDITAHFINEPLTATVLSQLDFTPFTEEILSRFGAVSNSNQPKLNRTRNVIDNVGSGD